MNTPAFSRRDFLNASLALGLMPRASGQPAPPSFDGTIVLGRPTANSVTVNVLFNNSQAEVYLEYGDRPGELNRRTQSRTELPSGVPFEDVIDHLEPDRRCFYRVCHKPVAQDSLKVSPEYSFHTQRARGQEFTFTVIADSHLFTEKHCDPERYALALQNAREDNPDFHIDLGDTFRLDSVVKNPLELTYRDVLARDIAHRQYFGILTHSAPLFLVPGNHDAEYGWYRNPASGFHPELPIWATNARKFLYPNPQPDSFYTGNTTIYDGIDGGLRENYYAWEWGDALFVVLDPYWESPQKSGRGWGTIHGDEQYRWFRDTLRNSSAKHKFVFEHHLHGEARGGVEIARLNEWGGRDQKGAWLFEEMRPGWEKPMHDLMVETSVKVYFQGHDHLYAKGELDGVVYLTVPMPGAGPDPAGPNYFPYGDNDDAYPESKVLPNSGHLRVQVSQEETTIEYVSVRLPCDAGLNKEVADTFSV